MPNRIVQKPHIDQAIWFLNAYAVSDKKVAKVNAYRFWNDGIKEHAEEIWDYTQKFANVDPNGGNGFDHDEVDIFFLSSCLLLLNSFGVISSLKMYYSHFSNCLHTSHHKTSRTHTHHITSHIYSHPTHQLLLRPTWSSLSTNTCQCVQSILSFWIRIWCRWVKQLLYLNCEQNLEK